MALQFPYRTTRFSPWLSIRANSPNSPRSMAPLWVYDAAVIRERIAQLRRFDVIRYAQKANSNIHILKLMRAEERWSTPCRWAR